MALQTAQDYPILLVYRLSIHTTSNLDYLTSTSLLTSTTLDTTISICSRRRSISSIKMASNTEAAFTHALQADKLYLLVSGGPDRFEISKKVVAMKSATLITLAEENDGKFYPSLR